VVVRRPGEMFGDQRRLVALDQRAEAHQMRLVGRLGAAYRHAHSMQGQRMISPEGLERAMRWTTGTHVILGMHLEEAALPPLVENSAEMRRLEAGAGEVAHRKGGKAGTLEQR